MKEGKEKVQDLIVEKLEYVEPVLIRLDERDKFEVGMCGVGVTGVILGSCPAGYRG